MMEKGVKVGTEVMVPRMSGRIQLPQQFLYFPLFSMPIVVSLVYFG